MKHQIILLGKDITSVYHGIKEFGPDHVHLLCTNETKEVAAPLFPLLPDGIRRTWPIPVPPLKMNSTLNIPPSGDGQNKKHPASTAISQGRAKLSLAVLPCFAAPKGRALSGVPTYPRQLTYAHTSRGTRRKRLCPCPRRSICRPVSRLLPSVTGSLWRHNRFDFRFNDLLAQYSA